MLLGERIKQLRVSLDMSQPQFADVIGVEQSYLSKLENNKSVPSNDVLRGMLNALEMTLDEFLQPLSQSSDRVRLMQIPDVEHWFIARDKEQGSRRKRLNYLATLMIALGVAIFYSGLRSSLFSTMQYEYSSLGVVYEGEPIDIYMSWERLLPRNRSAEEAEAKRLSMLKRRQQVSLLTYQNKGQRFVSEERDGLRLYRLQDTKKVSRPVNGWLQFIGLFTLVFGLVLAVLEPRLKRF